MKKNLLYKTMLCGIAFTLIPEAIFGVDTGTAFGGNIINDHANSLSNVLFGPVAKMGAIFGGITGVILGYLQQSAAKMLTFGGIMLASVALPAVIKGVYTMLLP
jgi:hypothetical protein